MMVDALRIKNGIVYDPANGVDGVVRDVLILDGCVVENVDAASHADLKTIDATGMIVMPGGIDMHCHIASAGVNAARRVLGEEQASHVHKCDGAASCNGTELHYPAALTPGTVVTGQRYAALGYTTALEAAVAPSAARQTHMQLDDTPHIDAGFLLLVANHTKLIELIDKGDQTGAVAFMAELMHSTGALGIKVVNPGGVASWRRNATHHTVETIDDPVAGSSATARKILDCCATLAEQLRLPHAPHIHCNRLGLPGNVETTLDTLGALDGRRMHLTHLQFHAYGKDEGDDFISAATRLTDYINDHDQVTADVGQVMFGDAMTLTADTPLEYALWQLTGKRATGRYMSVEIEQETGCGLMPIEYNDRNYLHSLQWAIGLELMLTCDDPWQMMLSTDHPNGGSFLTYPAIMAMLMSKALRDEAMDRANARAMDQVGLRDLSREFSLNDIAIITRAGPARALGLTHKGHLGAGADGDVTIYDSDQAGDMRRVFESPRYVIKGGQVLVEDGELRTVERADEYENKGGLTCGKRLRAMVHDGEDAKKEGRSHLEAWFKQHGSYDVSQFGLREFERNAMCVVPRR